MAQMADIVVDPARSAELEVYFRPDLVAHRASPGSRDGLTFRKEFERCKVGSYWDDCHHHREEDELEQDRSDHVS